MRFNILTNPYPFHLEKDFVNGYKGIIKKFTKQIDIEKGIFPELTDVNSIKKFLHKHLELFDSFSALQLEKEIVNRIESKKSDKLDLEKSSFVLFRKHFKNETASKSSLDMITDVDASLDLPSQKMPTQTTKSKLNSKDGP